MELLSEIGAFAYLLFLNDTYFDTKSVLNRQLLMKVIYVEKMEHLLKNRKI